MSCVFSYNNMSVIQQVNVTDVGLKIPYVNRNFILRVSDKAAMKSYSYFSIKKCISYIIRLFDCILPESALVLDID